MTDRTIWKFGLGEHEVPAGYQVVDGGLDPSGAACVWLSVLEGLQPTVKIETKFIGTGIWFEPDWKPVCTYVEGPFVWHILIREISNAEAAA